MDGGVGLEEADVLGISEKGRGRDAQGEHFVLLLNYFVSLFYFPRLPQSHLSTFLNIHSYEGFT